MEVAFWQGTVLGTLVGVLGSLAAFRSPLAVLVQISKDHERRITTMEQHRDGKARTRSTDTDEE